MEQHVGHATYSDNLRRALAEVDDIEQTWLDVRYATTGRPWERVPFVPRSAIAALRARDEIRPLGDLEPDVAFFNTQVPAVLGGRAVRRLPYVVAVDVTPLQYDRIADGYGHSADRRGPTRWMKHRLNTRVLTQAAMVVAWSSWVRESLISEYGVRPDRVVVIAPGVDTEWWRPLPRPATEGPIQILFVGGDLVRKGGDVLLDAFATLPAGAAELVLVTKSPVDPAPGVTVLSHLGPNSRELRRLFHSSDLFALPARAEAFGIAAVEAGAAGLPVIATSVGGLADIVIDGETGLVVSPGDLASLASSLNALVADRNLRIRLGAAARRRVEQHFDAHRNGEQIASILREAACR
ncbi:MAG: glycosyltransferase family 4 protein [Acidimicrobiia bacterium]|nr:glycosyltransferase family 4 protein [Acidimicrobiia bacterium]